MQNPTPSHLRTLRTILLITDAFGLLFAILASLLGGGYSFTILFLSLSGLFNLWVRHTEPKEGAIQLPLSPGTADTDAHTHDRYVGHRQGLIALDDFVSGAFLLAFHIIYVVLGRHYYGIRVLSLYAVFAMLGAAAMHFVLGVGHFKVWREERGRDLGGVCRVCRQRMSHDGEQGQVVEINEGLGTAKVGGEDRAVGHQH